MKARKVHNGRIFIFADRSCKDQVIEIRSIISDFDKDFETYINEIKVDYKNHLRQIVKNETKGQDSLPLIFLNSTYFGSLEKLKSDKQQDSKALHEKIRNTLEEQPGRIYQVYKRQSELLQILPTNM